MRPEDITPELLRQLGRDYRCRPYDSRQTGYAQYYDPSFYQHSLSEARITIGHLTDRNRTLKNEIGAANRSAAQRLFDLKQEKQNRRAEVSILQSRISKLKDGMEEVSARFDQLRETNASLAERLEAQRSETNNIRQEKEKLEACLVSKDITLSRLQEQIEEERVCIKRDAQQLVVRLTAKEAELQECRAQLEEAQQQNSALVKRNADLEAARVALAESIHACCLHRFWIWVALLRKICARSLIRCRNAMGYR